MQSSSAVPASASRVIKEFAAGRSCTEAMAVVFAERFGLPEDALRRAASGFGCGMGGMGGPCGAVTGAMMVIGMLRAPEDPYDRDARHAVYALVRRFVEEFTARCGTIQCAELTGHRMDTREGVLAAREAGVFRTVCPKLLHHAETIVRDVLDLAPDPS